MIFFLIQKCASELCPHWKAGREAAENCENSITGAAKDRCEASLQKRKQRLKQTQAKKKAGEQHEWKQGRDD